MIESQTFENQDFTTEPLRGTDFDACEFISCNFAEVQLGGKKFLECTFRNCEMSGAKLQNTAFRECVFEDCKLLGVHFDVCNTFLLAMKFTHCRMDLANFFQLDLTSSEFVECSLVEVDFGEAEMKGISLTSCKLAGAMFDNTNLENADLSGSTDLLISPSSNRITGMRVDSDQLRGLLHAYKLKVN